MLSTGSIYFIEAIGSGMVKIGFTLRMVGQRLRDLQTATWMKLEVLVSYPGYYRDERHLHARFHHLHVDREWFKMDEALAMFIEEMRRKHM